MRRFPPPRRHWGQNFLVDRRAAERIVKALDPARGEAVVEIGPGRGALTERLVREMGRIAAVEVDPALAAALRSEFGDERLALVEEDVLVSGLEGPARALGLRAGFRLVVVGNLPYNISKAVAFLLVRQRALVDRAVLTFQKEVAERITATPGGRAYGPLSVLVGETFRVERLFDLSPSAFRPRPAVVSTVTRWAPRPAANLPETEERALRECLAACFAHRRQMLVNNLRAALPGGAAAARAMLERAAIDGMRRAETLVPAEFRTLARFWSRAPTAGDSGVPAEETPLLKERTDNG